MNWAANTESRQASGNGCLLPAGKYLLAFLRSSFPSFPLLTRSFPSLPFPSSSYFNSFLCFCIIIFSTSPYFRYSTLTLLQVIYPFAPHLSFSQPFPSLSPPPLPPLQSSFSFPHPGGHLWLMAWCPNMPWTAHPLTRPLIHRLWPRCQKTKKSRKKEGKNVMSAFSFNIFFII